MACAEGGHARSGIPFLHQSWAVPILATQSTAGSRTSDRSGSKHLSNAGSSGMRKAVQELLRGRSSIPHTWLRPAGLWSTASVPGCPGQLATRFKTKPQHHTFRWLTGAQDWCHFRQLIWRINMNQQPTLRPFANSRGPLWRMQKTRMPKPCGQGLPEALMHELQFQTCSDVSISLLSCYSMTS